MTYYLEINLKKNCNFFIYNLYFLKFCGFKFINIFLYFEIYLSVTKKFFEKLLIKLINSFYLNT